MNRLMKAEWYRVSKSYNMLRWTFVFCIFVVVVGFLSLQGEELTGIESFNAFVGDTGMIYILYLPMFVAGMFVASYENKVFSYEVMAGNKPSKIILSKIFTIVPLITVGSVVIISSVYFINGNKSSFGDDKYIALELLLLAIVIFRIATVAVLIMSTFKSTIGMFVTFLRFMVFESFGYMMLLLISDSAAVKTKGAMIFIEGEIGGISEITSQSFSSDIVWITILASFIEIAIWYVLSYNSYKKKWFN